LYPITVKRKVETMNITGIKTPTAGNKPDVTGITISTKESNALHPFKFIVDSTKVKWEGTFDKYGNFKSNTGYTLVIPYQPDYGGEFYDFDTEKASRPRRFPPTSVPWKAMPGQIRSQR